MDIREITQEIQSLQERAQRLDEQLQNLSPEQIDTLPALQPTLEGLWETLQAKNGSMGSNQTNIGRLFTENQHQRALLDAIFEADPGGLAVLTGPDLRFVFANLAYRYVTPDPTRDPVGQLYDQVWPHKSKHGNRDRFRDLLQTGQPFQVVGFEHSFQDGTRRVFTLQARRMEWDGQPAVLLILWDVTELKQANARLRSVLGSITELYAVFDRDWRIVDLNRAAEQHYFPNQLPGAMLGKNAWEVLPEAVGGEFYKAMHQAMETGRPVHTEAGSDITGKWYEVHAYPREGQLELYLRDISERHQAGAALHESEARLKRTQEIAHLGSWELDLTTNRLTWSEEVYRIFGLSPRAFGGTYEAFLDAVHPDDRGAVDAAYSGSLREGRDSYEIEHRVIRHSTGEVRIVQEKCENIRDRTGRIVGSIGMTQDITERKQAEHALRTSADLYHAIARSIPDGGVCVVDRDLRFLVVEGSLLAELGMTPELEGRQLEEGFDAESLPLAETRFRLALTGETSSYERSYRGRIIWTQYTPLRDEEDHIIAAMVIALDATARKRIEQELRFSKEQFTKAFDASPVGLVISRTEDGLVEQVNACFEEIFGYRREEVIGKTSLQLGLFAHPEERQEAVRRLREKGAVQDFELEIRTKSGKPRQAILSAVMLTVDQESYMLTLIQDVTERKQAERQALEDAARIAVQQRLIEQREHERLQIAHDLHDGPIQELTGTALAIQGLLLSAHEPALHAELEHVRDSLQQQMADLRDYAGELRPPALAWFGLGRGIRAHLEIYREKHPELAVEYTEDQQEGELVPDPQRVAIYRVYQEALTNIVKHARASQVRIHLDKDTDRVRLEIQDNGRGFVVPQDWSELIAQGHLGLAGMRERADAVGGRLEFQSAIGRGTTVWLEVPLESSGIG